eukprot:CAMPEP_0113397864 /NCGR_PEP_ID=MMETSP0013_2-20120614/14626_1 /TAXON_ID=2843 ORGANISM="Skeletonema costatum, Strain 1716" /NCGR_SAMPLE_ID=MMETSP0013_2 /ASSEMBLY_ACC=CAM_ASM_000158 /LENGTH=499 /DNA_ID=CAMNT_0000282513 /DNA_START=76 /DNA_END=1575 /DNA_ORIENTATION=- /assembly_acc=CAM_ASM_000158
MPNPEADEKKVLGNAAYAAKDYDEAINQYTAAIALDSKNCVYFSNRSAAYAAKGDSEAAANDAQECVNVEPSFFKGYYRLARAQFEQKEFAAALATINSGLDVGTNDREQKKLMRKLKAEVKEAKDEEYRKTAAAQMQDCCAQGFQLMESLGLLNRPRDPQMERMLVEEMMKKGKGCVHGYAIGNYPEKGFYQEFNKTFIDAFNNVTYQTTKYRLGESFMSAFSATSAKFPEEWKDESKIELVVTNWVANGTTSLLHGKIDEARTYASYAFFIQKYFSVMNDSTFVPFSAQVEDLFYADEHTLVSFLRKHIPCSCLEEKYKEVKSAAKMSGCYNEHCSLPDRKVERSKANPCSRCRSAYYCSRECQKADWPRHKLVCQLTADIVSRRQEEADMKEASMKASTTSQSPQEPAVNNPTAKLEIVEQATNETNAGGEDADEHVTNDDSPETSAAGDVVDEGLEDAGDVAVEGLEGAGDVADDLPPRATKKGIASSLCRLFGF